MLLLLYTKLETTLILHLRNVTTGGSRGTQLMPHILVVNAIYLVNATYLEVIFFFFRTSNLVSLVIQNNISKP